MPLYKHIPTGKNLELTIEKYESIKHQGYYEPVEVVKETKTKAKKKAK